ncbi:mitochondrial intermembrane space import and assembly protein 40, partial [Aureobasidium melanogenum CBS 110374]
SRRFLSTAPPHEKSRSWKNSAVRWTLAGALVYYYNTSNVFAEEQSFVRHAPPETQIESETLPTLDAVTAKRHALQAQPEDGALAGSPQDLEEEAGQQGAFNEETGEINWDCPCLGGMAYGPCGEQFREAFSCFVYSKEEPKGMDCIDKFKYVDASVNCS